MVLQIAVWGRIVEGWSCTLSHSVSCFRWLRKDFPCHRGVREALLALNAELKIFSCEERYAFKVSNEAADVWRVMAKDTRNLDESLRNV